MKKINILIIMLLLISTFALANGNHESEIEEAKQLIDSEIDCDKLSDEQLETIGEYYMEQMHPGEAHEMMDQMMGGEGSDSLKQMHIQMARRLYCNEDVGGMMGMMGSGGMMQMMMGGGNMMNSGGMMGSSMWGGSWWLWNIIGIVFWIALVVALILLIIWLYKRVIGNGSALEILKKRFARGDITKKQYESMKKELK